MSRTKALATTIQATSPGFVSMTSLQPVSEEASEPPKTAISTKAASAKKFTFLPMLMSIQWSGLERRKNSILLGKIEMQLVDC